MKSLPAFRLEQLETRQFLSISIAPDLPAIPEPAAPVEVAAKSAPHWNGSFVTKEGLTITVDLYLHACATGGQEGCLIINNGKDDPQFFLVSGAVSANKEFVDLQLAPNKVVFGSLCGTITPQGDCITANLCLNNNGVISEQEVCLDRVVNKPLTSYRNSFAPSDSPLLGEWKTELFGKDGAVGSLLITVTDIDYEGVIYGEIGLTMYPKDQTMYFPLEGALCSVEGNFTMCFGDKECFGSICGRVEPLAEKLDVTVELSMGTPAEAYSCCIVKTLPDIAVERVFSVEPIELII